MYEYLCIYIYIYICMYIYIYIYLYIHTLYEQCAHTGSHTQNILLVFVKVAGYYFRLSTCVHIGRHMSTPMSVVRWRYDDTPDRHKALAKCQYKQTSETQDVD